MAIKFAKIETESAMNRATPILENRFGNNEARSIITATTTPVNTIAVKISSVL